MAYCIIHGFHHRSVDWVPLADTHLTRGPVLALLLRDLLFRAEGRISIGERHFGQFFPILCHEVGLAL